MTADLPIDIVWPAALPLPLIDYTGSPRNATIFSKENSPKRYRRSRQERSYSNLAVTWRLTREQYAVFKSFILDDLSNGTSQFKLELRYPLNSELTEWAVRIGNGYEAVYLDHYIWEISVSLDMVNPILIAVIGTPGEES